MISTLMSQYGLSAKAALKHDVEEICICTFDSITPAEWQTFVNSMNNRINAINSSSGEVAKY